MARQCPLSSNVLATGHWLINNEHTIVNDTLLGFVKCNPNLAILDFGKVVVRRNHLSLDKVKIVSGGASGLEPAYAGFVGEGMLTAAIQGDIFQAPCPDTIFRTFKELCRRHVHGILLILSDSLNDRLSFGLAVEKAKNIDNVEIKLIIVSDERRGKLARWGSVGTLLVQKIAGAMSEMGFFLDEIYNFCQRILNDIATISVSFRSPENPYLTIASCQRLLTPKIMEFGAGFSGEPGFIKMPIQNTTGTVKLMLENLLLDFELSTDIPIVIIINNLGSASKLEEQNFLQEVITQIQQKNIKIVKIFCGTFISALRMDGFTLTIMNLSDPKVIEYLDYPCSVKCWQEFSYGELNPELDLYLNTTFMREELRPKKKKGANMGKKDAVIAKNCIQFACDAVISCEKQLNIMDSEFGDGDTGTNMRAAVSEIANVLLKEELLNNPYEFFKKMNTSVESNTYGLTGLIYSIMFEAAARPFAHLEENQFIDAYVWLDSLKSALEAVRNYCQVSVGSCTMYDSFHACVTSFERALESEISGIEAFKIAALAAEEAAKNTKYCRSRGHPDPGAYCLAIVIKAICEAIVVTTEEYQDYSSACRL